MTRERVGVRDRLADLLERWREPPPVGGRIRPLPEQGGQGATLDQLHGQERPAVGESADPVHGRNAGVLELGGDPSLVGEPASDGRVGRVIVLEQLNSDVPVEGKVAGPVDDAHAAATDLIKYFVSGYLQQVGGGWARVPAPTSGADRRPGRSSTTAASMTWNSRHRSRTSVRSSGQSRHASSGVAPTSSISSSSPSTRGLPAIGCPPRFEVQEVRTWRS